MVFQNNPLENVTGGTGDFCDAKELLLMNFWEVFFPLNEHREETSAKPGSVLQSRHY